MALNRARFEASVIGACSQYVKLNSRDRFITKKNSSSVRNQRKRDLVFERVENNEVGGERWLAKCQGSALWVSDFL
jgi:hypothetical protein